MTYHRSCISYDRKSKQKPKVFWGTKSKNVLDIRMVPGDPQGAWVECYNNSYEEEAQEGVAEVKNCLKECVFVNSALKIDCFFGDFALWVTSIKYNHVSSIIRGQVEFFFTSFSMIRLAISIEQSRKICRKHLV